MSREQRDAVVERTKKLLVECLTLAKEADQCDPYGRAIRQQMLKEAQAHYSTLSRFDERAFTDQISDQFEFNAATGTMAAQFRHC